MEQYPQINRRNLKFTEIFLLGNKLPLCSKWIPSSCPNTDPDWFINITDNSNGLTQTVQVISPYTPYKSLGTIQGLCKKQDDQFKIQLAKSKRLTQALACSGISTKYALINWNLAFVSSISYLLGICHLTDTQLYDLQKKYFPVVLNKIGFVRTYAQAK